MAASRETNGDAGVRRGLREAEDGGGRWEVAFGGAGRLIKQMVRPEMRASSLRIDSVNGRVGSGTLYVLRAAEWSCLCAVRQLVYRLST